MNDDEKFFINRHGKKVLADGTELETPPAEENFLENKPQQATTPPKVRKVRKKRPIKKRLIIAGVVLLVIVVAPVLGGELVRARYIASRDGAKAQLLDFATKTVVPQQKKQITPVQLSETAARVETIRDDACDGGITDNLATLYPRAKSAFDDCIAVKQKIAAVAVSLRDIESQARYLEGLSPLLDAVSKPATDEFAVISAQLTNWQTLNDALGKLSPAASQRSAHDQLKAQTKAIVDAWSALNTANNNQDGVAFAAAEKKLGESYETFRSSSSALAKIMDDAQAKLIQSYRQL